MLFISTDVEGMANLRGETNCSEPGWFVAEQGAPDATAQLGRIDAALSLFFGVSPEILVHSLSRLRILWLGHGSSLLYFRRIGMA